MEVFGNKRQEYDMEEFGIWLVDYLMYAKCMRITAIIRFKHDGLSCVELHSSATQCVTLFPIVH